MGETIMHKYLWGILLLGTLTFAQEQFPFVGINISHQTVELEDETSNSTNTFALHTGKQSLRWRTTFFVDYSSDYRSIGADFDYILLDTMFGTSLVRPYIGTGISYLYLEETPKDHYGYQYGLRSGFIIYAGERFDVDLGYHYNYVKEIEGIDRTKGANLSLHYFY